MGEEEIVLPTGVGLVTESKYQQIPICSASCHQYKSIGHDMDNVRMLLEPEVGSFVRCNTGEERLPDKELKVVVKIPITCRDHRTLW